MSLGPQSVLPAPPTWDPVHTLRNASPCYEEITSTDAADNRWGNGFGFEPDPCPTPSVWDPNCPVPGAAPVQPGGGWDKSDPLDREVVEDQKPFIIETAFSCSPRSQIEYEEIARRQLDRILDKTLEWQFWTGAGLAGHPDSLRLAMGAAVPVINDDPATPITGPLALQRITQAWANCGPGGRGMIHAPPSVVAGWSCECLNERAYDDGRPYLETKVGRHVVVPGQGYNGTGPNGEVPDPGTAYIYMTGPVCVVLGPVLTLTDDGHLARQIAADGSSHPKNEVEVRAERPAAAYFDPTCCAPIAALVETSCCC